MRTTFAKLFYTTLISPLIPIACLCWLFEKLNSSKTLCAWESWARNLTKKVTGV
ncbi:hypothetical protein HIIECEMK_00025 [Klebsiella phage vB_KqP-Goliath]|nr:hypothetical protein HIIECEMK_00025 [Klebsiella phage vB_KqP-Goliath]CAD5239530.1 hypothetical protein BLCJPOBP_00024 [Klebsiella phage vB_KpP-Yoda]